MTDGSGGWASPSGGAGDEPPRWGERTPEPVAPASGPPASAQPAWGAPTSGPPAPTSYRPPPRRGLIPLHPLSFGQLLGAAFGVIRWNPRATVVPAIVVSLVQTVLLLGGGGLYAFAAFDRIQRAADDADRGQIIAGAIGGGVVLGLLVIAFSVFTGALLQGMLVTVVARASVGERATIGQGVRAAIGRVLPLIGIALLLGLAQVVAVVLLALLVLLLASLGKYGWIGATIVGVLGGLGLAVLYVFVGVKVATAPSVVVLEHRGVLASIRRSWVLVRGSFWRTFGLLALVLLMVSVAAQIVNIPFSVLGGAVGGLLAPNAGSDPQSSILPLLLSSIPGAIAGVVVGGVGQVAQVAAVVLVYLDLRMRREGLDIDLQRFVEQGGPDPLDPPG